MIIHFLADRVRLRDLLNTPSVPTVVHAISRYSVSSSALSSIGRRYCAVNIVIDRCGRLVCWLKFPLLLESLTVLLAPSQLRTLTASNQDRPLIYSRRTVTQLLFHFRFCIHAMSSLSRRELLGNISDFD